MKEISEINKKINLGSGGPAAQQPVPKPAERPLPPGTVRGSGGLSMFNAMAPHLKGSG